MKVTDDIYYVGVNDHQIDLFEGQYEVPNGMAYNSYVILDDKSVVMDSVDINFAKEWIKNIKETLKGKEPDYIVIQHMEPDHSGSLQQFMDEFENTIIVSSLKAFVMMKNFIGQDYSERRIVVGENDTLSLGKHTIKFITAPMVHWPEVIVTYDECAKVLFSADGFGKFGALDVEEEWACEARRYYFGIVGKYGAQVQALLKKVASLDIETICPLHGPILKENLGYYIDLYNIWSSYGVETEGVAIFYTSVYGHTKEAVLRFASELKELGCPKVAINDLAREDMAECVEDAFRYGKIVLATTTYNNDIFPFMKEFINHLVERGYKGRKIALIENGSWACNAGLVMKKMLESCKGNQIIEPSVKIISSMKEKDIAQIKEVAKLLLDKDENKDLGR
ncbi:MAG: FprA family A-type flavoprotein [Bacilli bacterium]